MSVATCQRCPFSDSHAVDLANIPARFYCRSPKRETLVEIHIAAKQLCPEGKHFGAMGPSGEIPSDYTPSPANAVAGECGC